MHGKRKKQKVMEKKIESSHHHHFQKEVFFFSKHFKSMMFRKPELKETFTEPPMPAYSQATYIRKIVCQSTLPIITREDNFIRKSEIGTGLEEMQERLHNLLPLRLLATSEVTGYMWNRKLLVLLEMPKKQLQNLPKMRIHWTYTAFLSSKIEWTQAIREKQWSW